MESICLGPKHLKKGRELKKYPFKLGEKIERTVLVWRMDGGEGFLS